MYSLSSYHKLPPVSNYAEAQVALEAFNFEDHKVVMLRHTGTGIIAFRLYDTDVVTWHPDNSVVIRNFGTVTTSDFARRFLPRGIALRHPVTRRSTGESGHRTIAYIGKVPDDGWWWEKARYCHGEAVRFTLVGDEWLPDETTIDEMYFPVIDKAGARKLSKASHLADFERWLSMAPRHLDLQHQEWDVEQCELALAERDFKRAAVFLPLIIEPSGFGTAERIRAARLSIATSHWQEHVTMGSVRKLKLALWERAGLVSAVADPTPSRKDFEQYMSRVRELGALGADVSGYGPQP